MWYIIQGLPGGRATTSVELFDLVRSIANYDAARRMEYWAEFAADGDLNYFADACGEIRTVLATST